MSNNTGDRFKSKFDNAIGEITQIQYKVEWDDGRKTTESDATLVDFLRVGSPAYSDKEIKDAIDNAHYNARTREGYADYIMADAMTALAMIAYKLMCEGKRDVQA